MGTTEEAWRGEEAQQEPVRIQPRRLLQTWVSQAIGQPLGHTLTLFLKLQVGSSREETLGIETDVSYLYPTSSGLFPTVLAPPPAILLPVGRDEPRRRWPHGNPEVRVGRCAPGSATSLGLPG